MVMPINFPMMLTWLRILMIPLFVAFYYVPESWVAVAVRDTAAALVFIVAAVTD